MTNPRDTQRQRLYDAEEKACCAIGMAHWGQTIKNADLQGFVNMVLANRAVAARSATVEVAAFTDTMNAIDAVK